MSYTALTKCTHCSKDFPPSTLPQTKRNHVLHCRRNPSRRTYECQKCSKRLGDITAMRRHLQSRSHNTVSVPVDTTQPCSNESDEADSITTHSATPKRYQLILADPPWEYGGDTHTASAREKYKTMPLQDLADLDIAQMADAKSCALLMWASGPTVPHALQLIDAWGFKYVTVFVNWVKNAQGRKRGLRVNHGVGKYTRPGSELLLLAKRGNVLRLKRPKGANGVSQVLVASRREHSRKPDEQYTVIDKFFDPARTPNRLELFARQRREGWEQALSDQADQFLSGQ